MEKKERHSEKNDNPEEMINSNEIDIQKRINRRLDFSGRRKSMFKS